MRLKYILSVVLLCAGLIAQGHPLHLTFSNLEFNTRNSHWVLTIKVFTDDFSSNLKLVTGSGAINPQKSRNNETEFILKKWLENRFVIWFDSKKVESATWKFDGIKVKDDASWITFTFTAPLPVAEIKIRNTLLFDLYTDQKNLFILAMGQMQSAHEFKNKDQETIIKLNK